MTKQHKTILSHVLTTTIALFVAFSAVLFAVFFVVCTARADAPPAVDSTAALAAELRVLGRDLVQRQLPKGAPALPDAHPFMRHALDAAPVVAEESFGIEPPALRRSVARMVYVMGGFESGWQADPKGSSDAGAACGYGQVHSPEKVIPEATCAAVRKDLRLGVRVTYALVWTLTAKYKTLARALTVYATGVDHGAWVLPEIARRCKLAGVDCATVKLVD